MKKRKKDRFLCRLKSKKSGDKNKMWKGKRQEQMISLFSNQIDWQRIQFFLLFQNIWKSKRKLLSCQRVLSSRNFTIQLDRSREKRRQHESSLSNDDVCMILWAQKCTWTQENSIESETEFSVSFESFKWNKRMEFKRRIEWWKLREATPRRKKKIEQLPAVFQVILWFIAGHVLCVHRSARNDEETNCETEETIPLNTTLIILSSAGTTRD